MANPVVLLAAPAKSAAQRRILEASGAEVVVLDEPLQRSLSDALPGANGVCLGILDVDADLLERATSLKIVARQGSGTDMVDTAAADRLGIWVTNTPGANARAVAEYTLGSMIAAARHLFQANEVVKRGAWRDKAQFGLELEGKTVGVVGLGAIGRIVVSLCRAFGMHVIGFDPFQPAATFTEIGAERCIDIVSLAKAADVLTLHIKASPDTQGLISREVLGSVRDGCVLVNAARAELVDDDALLEVLDSGAMAAAVLDVFREEPPRDRRLVDHPRVIATPHTAGWTFEARERMTVEAAREVVRVLSGDRPLHPVNAPPRPRNR